MHAIHNFLLLPRASNQRIRSCVGHVHPTIHPHHRCYMTVRRGISVFVASVIGALTRPTCLRELQSCAISMVAYHLGAPGARIKELDPAFAYVPVMAHQAGFVLSLGVLQHFLVEVEAAEA